MGQAAEAEAAAKIVAEMKATTKMLESHKCVKLLLKRLILYDSKVSSAHPKSASKCLQSTNCF